MTKEIRLLSGGAAQGLVTPLRDRFRAESGFAVEGTFGAVGAMRDKLLAGEPCDLVILTQAIIDQLTADGHVVRGSDVPLGVVKTGVAVKTGEPQPRVESALSLKAALMAATGIYLPDPQKATAGIHFVKVLEALGIAGDLAPRLRPFPNGAAAMHAMAQSTQAGLIGCTQVTEILFAPGVELAGLLPKEYELATVYTAAVCTQAAEPDAARAFIRMLAGADAAELRAKGGFEAL
jgi:molybdate transport system substrate-binding protein